MPTPSPKRPTPSSPVSLDPNVKSHWEEPPALDGKTNDTVTDSFKIIVDTHVQQMLSELLKEHQSQCYSQQAEIKSLRDQLLKCGGLPNPETFGTSQVCNPPILPKTKQLAVDTPVPKRNRTGPPPSSFTKVDVATSFSKHASGGHELDLLFDASDLANDMNCQDRLQNFVQSGTFETLSATVILANVIVMAVQVQYDGYNVGHEIGLDTYNKPANEAWPGAEVTFLALDATFNILFFLELLCRFYAYRCSSVFMPWMWFDTIIVTMGLLDFISSGILIGVDSTMLRLVRLVRLTRLLKIFNAMIAFDSLFLLLKAMKASMNALFWSFLLLLGMQVGVSLLLVQGLHPLMTRPAAEQEDKERLFYFFGTFSKSMMTMSELTFANWAPVCRFLIDDVHETFYLFVILYRCILCFALLRVITAVFIAETNRVMTNDSELTVMKVQRERAIFKRKFLHLMHDIDSDNDGKITWSEMQVFLLNPTLCEWLSTIGLNRQDFEKLFWLLEVDQAVDISKFLSMIGDLKGQAKTVDLLNLFKFMHSMHDDLHKALQLDIEEDPAVHAFELLAETGDIFGVEESPEAQ